MKQTFASIGERRRFWEKFFGNDRLAQSLANRDDRAVADTTERLLGEPLDNRGEVVLVGAGPGMPDCSPSKGCSRSSRRTLWFTTGWSPTTS